MSYAFPVLHPRVSRRCKKSVVMHLLWSAGDEEPLVDAWVDGCWDGVFTRWDLDATRVDSVRRLVDSSVGAINGLASRKRFRPASCEAYSEISPLVVLPMMRRSQASAHSRTMSIAYLPELAQACRLAAGYTHFLFLHSPEKANWFSGLPSGIL